MKEPSRYDQLIEAIFFAHYEKGVASFEFQRSEIEKCARELGIRLPKNLGDLIYSFRFRTPLPQRIRATAPKGKQWVIRSAGRSVYCFAAAEIPSIVPNPMLVKTRIPDATPGIIAMYALNDEQALLAKLRYNRLIDIFTRVTCYSLQSHLRTTAPHLGQIETDEIYVGVDRSGAHYVFPVQAKGAREKLNIIQIEQDFELCKHKFQALICRPIGTQFLAENTIVLFEFERQDDAVRISQEKHYQLVPSEEVTAEMLEEYRRSVVSDD